MHLIVTDPRWNERAYERACNAVISAGRAVTKSLEHANLDKVARMVYGPDKRFGEPGQEAVAALTSEQCREMVAKFLRPDNLEVRRSGSRACVQVCGQRREGVGGAVLPAACMRAALYSCGSAGDAADGGAFTVLCCGLDRIVHLHAVAACLEAPCKESSWAAPLRACALYMRLPAWLQITIVGDFDPQHLEEAFKSYFGTLPVPPEPLALPHAPIHFTQDMPLEKRHNVRLFVQTAFVWLL